MDNLMTWMDEQPSKQSGHSVNNVQIPLVDSYYWPINGLTSPAMVLNSAYKT